MSRTPHKYVQNKYEESKDTSAGTVLCTGVHAGGFDWRRESEGCQAELE